MLAIERAKQVTLYLQGQEQKLAMLATMGVFREALLHPDDPDTLQRADSTINELMSQVPGIHILTTDGIVIAGEASLSGTDQNHSASFNNTECRTTFERYYDPLRKKDYYHISRPIYDSADPTKVIGAIGFDLPLEEISRMIADANTDEDDEIYLIDETGLLLSASEYIGKESGNGILMQTVHSDGAQDCLDDLKKYGGANEVEAHTERVEVYRNYVGEYVLGAHAYVPMIMGCVLAEKKSNIVREEEEEGED